MSNTNKLKISRRNYKGQLSRTLTTLDGVASDDTTDPDIIKQYIAKAENQFQNIEAKHSELIDTIENEDEFQTEEKWMVDCEREFVEALLKARKVVNQTSSSRSPLPSTSTKEPSPEAETTITPEVPSPVNDHPSTPSPRMERIKLPRFSVDVRDYKRFKELFLHCTAGLPEIERFFQLTESMANPRERNKVKSCISVERAWEVLDECYEDQDKIVDKLLQDLENLKTYEIKNKMNLPAISRFVQALQVFENQAETVGLSGELNSKIMLGQIKQKMPEEHRLAYYKSVRDDATEDSLTGLVKWLYSQQLLLEKVRAVNADIPPATSSTQQRTPRSSHAVSTNIDGRQQRGKNNDAGVPKCALHTNSHTHFLKTCNKFKSLPLKDKYEIMKRNDICFRCGHNNCIAGKSPYDRNACQFVAPCRTESCGSDSHFGAICPIVYGEIDSGTRNQLNSQAPPFRPMSSSSHASTSVNTERAKLEGTLPTVMGYLQCDNNRRLVRILLDGGSDTTLLREGVFPRTQHDVHQDHELSVVGGAKFRDKLRLLDCNITDIGENWSFPITVTEINKPCADVPVILPRQLEYYDHLRDIEVPLAPSETVDLLLGIDNTHLMVWEEYVLGSKPEEPIVIKCPFGWFTQGGRLKNSTSLSNYVNVSTVGPIEEFIGLESVGLEPKRCKCSEDALNLNATETMQNSVTQLPDGSYEVQLPWRKSPDDLPDNFSYAVKRLKNLENQFKDRPKEWQVYCKQMQDQILRGVSRYVNDEELQQDRQNGKRMWFLPHFAVTKESKTTPVRVVYDAKARFHGHSLNDYLIKGTNINVDLFEVALRFRENEVGVIADISKMFQAIRLKSNDARFHRFVFRERPSQPIRVYELTTVTFGDKPSPTAAIVTLRHVVEEHSAGDEKLMRVVTDQFYMDDLNESLVDVEQALDLKTKLIKTLKKGNFAIRKWQSNAPEVSDETEHGFSVTVLGTKWDLVKDTLKVKEVKIATDGVLTKRRLLAHTAAYYDIFGMLSGILVRPKIMLQRLWQLNLDWDEPLNQDEEIHATLNKIHKDLQEVENVEIARCLIPEVFRGKRPLPNFSLHGASDACEDAMGIGIWLRWSTSDDSEAHLSFVCARGRVTPLKQSSIPRKVLQACLLLSRLMLTVKNALRFNISYMKVWTDSMTVISWLRGKAKTFRSYVAYRVGEITTEFDPHNDVAFVPTEQNVIDLVSRGGTAAEMNKVLEGPAFLKHPPSRWPETPKNVPVDPGDKEQKKRMVRHAKTLFLNVTSCPNLSSIVDPTKFSSWSRLKMVTARVLSVKDLPKAQWLIKLTDQISKWPSHKNIKDAELYWIRQAQKELDFEDLNIMKLDPFFDKEDEVYRVGGRVDRAPLSYDVRHPYLLPKKSHISMLIVLEKHRYALHGGHLRTAAEVRMKYWIVGDVNLSRKIVRDCITCKRFRGKPIQQKMSSLPEFRVKPCTPPFQTTIVDYLGPVNVKLNRNTTTKGYCAVFTCTVTRAVHLTCVQDLSTQAFLQALDRFVSIRGAPSLLITDNATCFRGANNTINELNLKLEQVRVREYCQRYNVQWKFGPLGGPHHQGAVERMVQEVKKGMKHLVKADRLPFVEWETVFCQISGLINSRPLTAKSSSPLDHPPLTPNHFLIGRGDLSCPEVPCEEFGKNPWRRREVCKAIVDGFWRRWMQCIRKLSPLPKWTSSGENLQENDIVLVVDENVKRGNWKMAEVQRPFPGKNNLVRVVAVKFADGTVTKRPVTKLISLMKKSERSDIS